MKTDIGRTATNTVRSGSPPIRGATRRIATDAGASTPDYGWVWVPVMFGDHRGSHGAPMTKISAGSQFRPASGTAKAITPTIGRAGTATKACWVRRRSTGFGRSRRPWDIFAGNIRERIIDRRGYGRFIGRTRGWGRLGVEHGHLVSRAFDRGRFAANFHHGLPAGMRHDFHDHGIHTVAAGRSIAAHGGRLACRRP